MRTLVIVAAIIIASGFIPLGVTQLVDWIKARRRPDPMGVAHGDVPHVRRPAL